MADEPVDVCRIPLTGLAGVIGHALVDPEDFQRLDAHTWGLNGGVYAARHVKVGQRDWRHQLMHRVVLGLERGDPREGDHINGNTLDNRRANLRVVTHAQNSQNRSAIGKTSKYRGVCWDKKSRRWRARVTVAQKTRDVGFFRSEIAAAEAAVAARREYLPFAVEDREPI